MPRAVNLVLTVSAWLAAPMWALAGAGAWAFSTRGEVLAAAAAAVTSFDGLTLYGWRRIGDLVTRHQDCEKENLAALVLAIDLLASGPAEPGDEAQPSLARAA